MKKHKQWIKFMDLLKCESLICKLLENEHIIKFFKCTSQNCAFTTDNPLKYEEHLRNHEDKTLPCPYCFAFLNSAVLTAHMLKKHWKLRYQCGYCWYRGWGKMHVRIHTKCAHVEKPLKILVGIELKGEETQENIPDYLEVTKSYYCNIGTCTFSTFDPSVFKEHCDTTHKTVSVFSCYYCKTEVLSFERLLKHLNFHGINSFQCAFCLHGTETQAKVVEHVTAVHLDKPLQFYVRGSHVLLKTYTPCLPMSTDPSKPITLPILLGNQSLQSGSFETSKLEHVTNLKFSLSPNIKDISKSDIVTCDPLLQREKESNKSLKPITVEGELNRNSIEITHKEFIPVLSKVSLDKTDPVKLAPEESSIKNNNVEATPCFSSLNYLNILDNLEYITDTSRNIKKEKRKIADQNILDTSLQKFVVCKMEKLSEDQKPQFSENSCANVKPKEMDLIHENKNFCRNEPRTSWRTSAKETVCISELGEITPESVVQEISNQFKTHSFPLQSLNNSLNCLGTQVNFANGEKSEVTQEGVEVLISCVSEISSENEEDEVCKNKWSKLSGSKVQKDVQVNSDLSLNKSLSYYSFMEQKVDCVDVSSATNTEASKKDNPLEKFVPNECLIHDKYALNTTISGVSTEDIVFKYKRLSDKTLNGIDGAESNKEPNLEKGMKCIYKCGLCSVEMVTHRHILQHLQNVHCVQLHKCGYCDRTSKSSKTLIHHCKKYHERTPKTVLMYEKIIETQKESLDSLAEVKSSTSFIENNIEETVQNDGKKEESFKVKTKMGKTNDLQLINGPVDNTNSFLKCKINSLSTTDQHLDRELNKVEHQAVFSKQQKSQTEGNVSLNNLLDSRRENNLFGNTDQCDWVRESKQSYNTKVCENPLEFLSNNDFQKVSQNQFLFSMNKDNEKSITSVATSCDTNSHNLAFLKQKFNAPKDKSFLFICPFCGYAKASYCDLKLHLFRELKYHRLLCLVCNMSCFGRKEIKAHFQRHHPGEELYYEHKCDRNTEQLVENFLRIQEILTEKNKMLLLSNTQILKETKKRSKTSLFDKKCRLLCMYEKAVALSGESSVMNFKKDQEVPNPEKNIDNFTEAKIKKNPKDKGKESIVNAVSKRTIEEDTNPLLSEELKKSGNKVIKFCHEEIKSKNKNFAFSLFCAKHDKTEVQDEFLNSTKESSGISNALLVDFEKESVQSFNHKLENNSVITKKQHKGADDTHQSIANTNTSLLLNSDEEKSKKDPLLFICPFCDYAKASYCEQKLHLFRELKYHRLLCVRCNVSCFGKREMKAHFRRYHPGEELYYERKCDRNIEELVERFLRNQENLTAKNKMLLNHEQMQRATKQRSDISVLEKKCKLLFICENVKTTKSPPIYFTDDYSDIKMQERKEISNTEVKKIKNATNESKLYVIGDTNNGQKGTLKESTHLFPKETLKLENTPCLSEVIKYKYEEVHFSTAVESNIGIQNSPPKTEKNSTKEKSNQCDNSLNRTLQKLSSIDKKSEVSPVLFSCPFCNYTCSSYRTQKQHMYRELKYCRFFCLLCKTKFFNIKGLKAHFQKCHFGQKLCYEQKCDAETEEWVDHLLNKQKKLSVKGSKYLSLQANHSLNSQTSKKQYKYTCLFCGARKCSTGNFKKHLFNHKQYRPVKCFHCNKKFRYTCEVKQHLERHHPGLASYSTITKSDSIEDWVNEIISSQQLSNHHVMEQELHLDQTNLKDGLSGVRMKKHSVGAFTCHWQNCSFVTDDKKKLKYHLMIHFSRTSFSCPFCQTLFDSEAKLKSHCEFSHSEKSLPTASIKNENSLSYGMKKNQLGNNSKTITCSYCGLVIYSDKELKLHICWEHQNESKEDIIKENDNVASASQPHDKVLECESCGIKFAKRDEMLQHLKSHEKVLKSTDFSTFVNFSLYNKDQNSRFVTTMGSKNETNPSLNVSCEVPSKTPAVNNGEVHLVLDELSSKDTISRNVTRCAYCRKNVPSDTIKQHCRKQHPNLPVKIIKHRPKTPLQLPKFYEHSCEKRNPENLKEDLLLNFVEHKSGENFYLSEKEPYRCEYCPAHFSCVTHLQKHWQVEHQKKLNFAIDTGMHDTKQENSSICNAVNQLPQQLNSKSLERKSDVLHCASQLNDFAETFSQENYYPYVTEPTSSGKRQIPQENTNISCGSLSQGEFSFYGKKQKIDTSNIKVHIPSLGANIPYQSVTHLCNLQPCVLLTDLKSQLFTLGLS
ncbi:uncharacterized protein LOC143244532 [Tachypleus tridentatus]|uniref:uncharacterized protein LOC143244532 n=1 Tax=Tachypleus tridentatus TaxID=6853 RepID=UPI003FD38937